MWNIEVVKGDVSKLIVYDFAHRGGGKGNKLNMIE